MDTASHLRSLVHAGTAPVQDLTRLLLFPQKTQPKIEEEEEEEVRKQPDPLHQLILHFSHNALTECR